jgi:hypothetical protein
MKQRGERIVMLTAYDATMARLLNPAGTDLLLVGDPLGQVNPRIGHDGQHASRAGTRWLQFIQCQEKERW